MEDYCVCAEPLEERGLYPCGHALCLSCTMKKRALMRDKHCPYCRAEANEVAVILNKDSNPSDAKIDFHVKGVRVENEALVAELKHILAYPCPLCDKELKTYKNLKKHVADKHEKVLCDVCTKHELVFSDEYRTYTEESFKAHLKSAHVKCKYCNINFYGPAEFLKHCRETHMGCEICEQRDPQHPKYYKTYEQLQQHYKDAHYMCMYPICLENKHIVFGTEMELKRHMADEHRGILHNANNLLKTDADDVKVEEARKRQDKSSRRKEDEDADDDAAAAKASRARQVASYEARLAIAANHNSDKIEQIRKVNDTFMHKNVPAEIFIATYESALKDVPTDQITSLLNAFKKAYSGQLSSNADRGLTFKLHQRHEAEELKLKQTRDAAALASSSTHSSSGTPTPTAIQKPKWSNSLQHSRGVSSLANLPALPTLGQKPKNRVGRDTWGKPPAATSRLGGALNNLPSLPSRSSTPQITSIRQSSVPLRTPSRTSSSSYLPSGSSSSTPVSTSSSAISLEDLHLSRQASTDATVNTGTSRGKKDKISLNRLPSLPKTAPSNDNTKKRHRNVIRIV